jgi:hypothetical protein
MFENVFAIWRFFNVAANIKTPLAPPGDKIRTNAYCFHIVKDGSSKMGSLKTIDASRLRSATFLNGAYVA